MADIRQQSLSIDGMTIDTVCIALGKAQLIIACAAQGYVMCGYLDITTAERMADTACIVRGVSTVDELLAAPVAALTSFASARGIVPGMSGKQALLKMR